MASKQQRVFKEPATELFFQKKYEDNLTAKALQKCRDLKGVL